jgi:hypothetical protein
LRRLQSTKRPDHLRPLSCPSYPWLLPPAFRLFHLLQDRIGESLQSNPRPSWR